MVSLRIAHTSILTSPLLSKASCNSLTTSSPSTPAQLNPLVHLTRVEPLLLQGEGEGEAQGQGFILNFSVQYKVGKAAKIIKINYEMHR